VGRSQDNEYLQRAAELATGGCFRVEPNPVVGCVLVRRGRIVGEGFHAYWGGPHAEVAALRDAGREARGATAYITLEPCGHRGKTSACSAALIRAGVREVVYAAVDPNPVTAGDGPKQLHAAGVEVRRLRVPSAIKKQLAPYLGFLESKRPWVIAKWAMTLDGRIATRTGDSRWVSNESSRRFAHRHFRARCDAILAGAATIRIDDPALTNRAGRGGKPLRVVVCGRRRLPRKAQVLDDAAPTLLAAPEGFWAPRGADVITVGRGGRVQPGRMLRALHRRGIRRLLVEGGGEIHGALFDKGLVDQVLVFQAKHIVGGLSAFPAVSGRGRARMADAWRLQGMRQTDLDEDHVVEGYVVPSRA